MEDLNSNILSNDGELADPFSILDFFRTIENLKRTKRTGWVEHGIKGSESIGDHMHRMSVMAMMIQDKNLSIDRCIKIAIVHDLAESVVGDIAPSANVSKQEKYKLEKEAMESFVLKLNKTSQIQQILELWQEYEDSKSPEAKLVKDLDKFEMIDQAFIYEQSDNIRLDSFFESTQGKFKHSQVRSWVHSLYKKRAEYHKDPTLILSLD